MYNLKICSPSGIFFLSKQQTYKEEKIFIILEQCTKKVLENKHALTSQNRVDTRYKI